MFFSRIKGHPNLVRDEDSKAVINTSKDEFLQAKKLKELAKEKEAKFETLENRINNIEGKIDKLIELLEKK
jgi:hypothetical protein